MYERSRKTKIIATLGPSTQTTEVIAEMLRMGADAFRINFSHSSHDETKKLVQRVREAEKMAGKKVPIIADLQGPTVRLGDFPQMYVSRDREYTISRSGEIVVDEDAFYDLVAEGDTIIIDGGRLWAKVLEKKDSELKVKFLTEGPISSRKTIAIHGKEYPFTAPTEKDVDDLRFAASIGIEGVAMSFVKTRSDILNLKGYLQQFGARMFIISKIETISAVNNLRDILEETDYVLVARGDLGTHYPLVKIPEIQRHIIEMAMNYGKPSIVATQLLESMIENQMPTRAEITDVFMAVSMGADSLMVSGETAVGKYPVEVVRWLNDIAAEAERYQKFRVRGTSLDEYDKFAEGVAYLSELIEGKLVAITTSGKTPQRLARFRPRSEIIGVCRDEFVFKKLRLVWGVVPFLTPEISNDQAVIQALREAGLLRSGEKAVITRSLKQGVTDAIKIVEV
ncbi:MAG: pyruvate kinase [Nitrososphaeria archaeon]